MDITTTELGKRLGVQFTVSEIVRLTGISGTPANPGKGGGYLWDEYAVVNIGRALAEHFGRVAESALKKIRSEETRSPADDLATEMHKQLHREDQILPLPPFINSMKIGRTYRLPHGPLAFWDGQRLQLIQETIPQSPPLSLFAVADKAQERNLYAREGTPCLTK